MPKSGRSRWNFPGTPDLTSVGQICLIFWNKRWHNKHRYQIISICHRKTYNFVWLIPQRARINGVWQSAIKWIRTGITMAHILCRRKNGDTMRGEWVWETFKIDPRSPRRSLSIHAEVGRKIARNEESSTLKTEFKSSLIKQRLLKTFK